MVAPDGAAQDRAQQFVAAGRADLVRHAGRQRNAAAVARSGVLAERAAPFTAAPPQAGRAGAPIPGRGGGPALAETHRPFRADAAGVSVQRGVLGLGGRVPGTEDARHAPVTRTACLRVASRLGDVASSGALPTAAAGQRASTVARAVPGVTRVYDRAILPGVPAGARS